VLVFSHTAASGWLGWGRLFAEMYARNNIIVWGTRGLMRLFAVLLAAADCGQDAMGPNSGILVDRCRGLGTIWSEYATRKMVVVRMGRRRGRSCFAYLS
jgi:hypothetical protein